MYGEQRHISRRNAADAHGLAEASRGELRELDPRFGAETGDRCVIDPGGNQLVFQLGEALDLLFLTKDVGRVLDGDLNALGDGGIDGGGGGETMGERLPIVGGAE